MLELTVETQSLSAPEQNYVQILAFELNTCRHKIEREH